MHPVNKIFEKVFIITMKDSQRSKNLKDKFQFDYELFYGVDGRRIDRKGSKWSHGQLGCTMSHINLYKHIIDNNISNVLILEDDALPHDNIKYLEEHMSQLPSNWEMIYLFYTVDGIFPNYNKNWFKLNQDTFRYVMCTSSIALQLDFVKEVYELNKYYSYTADGAYSEIVKQKNKECYLSIPRLFDVDYNTPSVTVEVDKCLEGKEYQI